MSFAQLKVFSNGGVVSGDNSGIATPDDAFTIVDDLTSVTIKESSWNGGANNGVMDITGGVGASLRIGAINKTSNSFGGAAVQFFSDTNPSFPGSFFFDAGANAGAAINFRTSLTTKMIITQAGKVGIGKNNPSEALDVVGNIKTSGMLITSDGATKKNLSSFDRGLAEVMQLNPVSYQYNGLAGTIDGDSHIGVVAQELAKVAPELVSSYTHVESTEATLEEVSKVISSEDYLQIRDNEIKYMLINAIKDQQALIEAQAEKIAALEEAFSTIGATEVENKTQVSLSAIDLAELGQNTPNPFNGTTRISYVVPTNAATAQISIFGLNGQLMKTLDIEHVGNGTLEVNASDLPSGTYTYQLVVDGKSVDINKMVLSK